MPKNHRNPRLSIILLLCIALQSCGTIRTSAHPAPPTTATPAGTATNTPRPTLAPTPAPLDYSIFPDFSPCTKDEDGGTLELWKCPYQKRKDFFVGGWVGDYLQFREWQHLYRTVDPLAVFKQNGLQWAKTCVRKLSSQYLADTAYDQWKSLRFRTEYLDSLEYSARVLKEAASKGFHLDLCFYLNNSRNANASQQPAPTGWDSYDLEQTAQALEEYTYTTTTFFKNLGLEIELYEIGNEIEWGIVGYTTELRLANPNADKTTDMSYMIHSVWKTEAYLLKAAIRGVKRADPSAKTVLHIDSMLWFDNDDVVDRYFFKTMVDEHVPFDYAGFTGTYPNPVGPLAGESRDWYFQRFQKTVDYVAALKKPVLISETAYDSHPGPSTAPMKDYPFSPEGQAAWVRDWLRFASNNPDIRGLFYWEPELLPISGSSNATPFSGLFATDEEPLPALSEFRVTLP